MTISFRRLKQVFMLGAHVDVDWWTTPTAGLVINLGLWQLLIEVEC